MERTCFLLTRMSDDTPTSSRTSAEINLRRLAVLRAIVVAAQLVVVIAAAALNVPLLFVPVTTVIALSAGLVVFTFWRLRHPRPVSDAELFAQLLIDVAALTALLYLSGGSTNPFVVLYLLPLSVTAAALPGVYAWAVAGVAAACYTALLWFYIPLPYLEAGADMGADMATGMRHGDEMGLHVIGMWLGFMFSAGLITYFSVRMAYTLRERDRAVAALRERDLRHERVLALGTLAAGAAHELGTPLSTLAILAKELQTDVRKLPAAMDKVAVLREQVQRCKEILATLSASAGAARAESGRPLALDIYLDELLARWHALRPAVALDYRGDGARPGPAIVAEQTLSQAITNILNNAADVSPAWVQVRARWNPDKLELEVHDRGPGVSPAFEQRAGQDIFTTKEAGHGLGLGLFLAHTTLQRLGGAIRLYNRADGGACTHLTLPLTALLVHSP